jgi:hypothetical protein
VSFELLHTACLAEAPSGAKARSLARRSAGSLQSVRVGTSGFDCAKARRPVKGRPTNEVALRPRPLALHTRSAKLRT